MSLFGLKKINDAAISSILSDLDSIFMSKVDKSGAKVLDIHRYKQGEFTYKQTVYRLKDGITVYVETEIVQDDGLKLLQDRLKLAVKEQRYEDAARIRDEIKEKEKT